MKVALDRVLNLTLWALQGLLAAVFLYSGAGKLNPHAGFWAELFGKIGIGQWLLYFTGSLEVVCAVLLLIPRTSAIAAGLLALIMVGAVATHLLILGDGYAAFFPASSLVALIAVAWKRSRLRPRNN